MTSGQQKQSKRRRRAKARNRQSGGLVAHRAFAPMLGLWGAALGGGTVVVLPGQAVTAALAKTGMNALGAAGQYVLAGAAALLLGALLFMVAASLSNRSRKRADAPSIAEVAARRVRTIDPARDLGSRSLDEPVETPPFARPAYAPAAAPSPAATAQPDAAPMPPPLALDLAEFAQMPGRNAVWVEQAPAPQPAPLPAPLVAAARSAPARAPEPGAGAITRLRAAPTDALSLAEVVERFAAALHDHRAAEAGSPGHNRDLAARDAALAEALKALAALSADPQAPAAGEPLRDALTRLQRVGGRA
jgi:hypothetical protein